MSMLRDQAARRRLELNPITTSSLGVSQQLQPHQTPISTLSAASLSSQFGYNPQAYTPLSAVRQYYPQQWTPSPSVLSDRSHVSQQFAQVRPQDPDGMQTTQASILFLAVLEGSTNEIHSSNSCTASIFPTTKSAASVSTSRGARFWNIAFNERFSPASIWIFP